MHECTCNPGFMRDTLIPQVGIITDVRTETPDVKTFRVEALGGGKGSALGTGGMVTKIRAAHIATEAGVDMIITNGSKPQVLYDIAEGKAVGTRFLAGGRKSI